MKLYILDNIFEVPVRKRLFHSNLKKSSCSKPKFETTGDMSLSSPTLMFPTFFNFILVYTTLGYSFCNLISKLSSIWLANTNDRVKSSIPRGSEITNSLLWRTCRDIMEELGNILRASLTWKDWDYWLY